MKVKFLFSVCAFSMLFLASCTKEYDEVFVGDYTVEQYETLSKTIDIPADVTDYNTNRSFINNYEAVLGRVLFYDKSITKHENLSCASCHQQKLGFSDDVALSRGVDDQETSRNSPALGQFDRLDHYYQPSSFSSSIFWDGRAANLVEQLEETMQNSIEMDINFDDLVSNLKGQSHYDILFERAYDDTRITKDRVVRALESFMRTFKSDQSKFDDARPSNGSVSNDWSGLTASENSGKKIFNDHCQSCHLTLTSPTTSNMSNNGLDLVYEDKGKYTWTNMESDKGVFKAPSLRNIAVTGPYMHDGRLETLEDVIDFYNDEVKAHKNLHKDMKNSNGTVKKLNLTDTEKEDLKNFMLTLTDRDLLHHEKWSDPFKA